MIDINSAVKEVTVNPNLSCLIMDKSDENPDFFEDECYNTIEPDVLNCFLDVVNKQKSLVPMLACLLTYAVDENGIDNFVYEKIKILEQQTSFGLLRAIAHYPIAVYQLMEINSLANYNKRGCTEAFCQLLYLFCTNDCFTANDLLKLLEETVTPLFVVKDSYHAMKTEIREQKKIKILENYIEAGLS